MLAFANRAPSGLDEIHWTKFNIQLVQQMLLTLLSSILYQFKERVPQSGTAHWQTQFGNLFVVLSLCKEIALSPVQLVRHPLMMALDAERSQIEQPVVFTDECLDRTLKLIESVRPERKEIDCQNPEFVKCLEHLLLEYHWFLSLKVLYANSKLPRASPENAREIADAMRSQMKRRNKKDVVNDMIRALKDQRAMRRKTEKFRRMTFY